MEKTHQEHLNVSVPVLAFAIGAILWSFFVVTYLMVTVMDAARS